jgi:hypothetical protein
MGTLPKHWVSYEDDIRVEISTRNKFLTKEQAKKLIDAYDDKPGLKQVSIRKPDKNGNYLPWAVWNAGEHTKFQDYLFE